MKMEDSRKDLLYRYIEYLYTTGKSYEYIARHIKSVKIFLESEYPINRQGYAKYIKTNAIVIVEEPITKSALLEFLSFNGVKYRSKKQKNEIIKLEKLSSISKRNTQLINDFIYYLSQEEDYSPHTLSIYSYGVKKYFEYANDVSVDNCKRFIKTLEESGMSPATIRLRITALERFCKFINKPINLKRPKFSRKLDTDNVPTEKEYIKLLEFLSKKDNKDYYFFIKILATTGARVSEFLQFTWENISAGEVTLRGKGNKYRRFFFQKSLREEISQYLKETGKTGFVAVGKYGRITDRGLNVNMKEWGRKCGIEAKKMHPHAFRHFFAKMFLKKNKDIVQLAELLGHDSIDTTKIYLQKSYDEQKKEFNRSVTW